MECPMIRQIATLALIAALAGCGAVRDSKLNPFNWFGASAPAEKVVLPEKPADPRGLVQQVVTLVIEPIPSGAIVRATGLPPTQGYWNAELVEAPADGSGRLVLEFRIFPPVGSADVNTPQSREVTAAIHLSNVKLRDVREIVVQGELNARAVRR